MRIHGSAQPHRGHLPSRRLAGLGFAVCVPVVAASWLFLAAIPVFADGGPHVMKVNNGSSGINADSCAGCHRAHTSKDQSGFLLTGPGTGINPFCLTCHGALGAGAATDVETGVQYTLAGKKDFLRTDASAGSGVVLGALRGGGFVKARIGSGAGYRIRSTANGSLDFVAKVPVGDASTATSAHLVVSGSGLAATGTTWGYSQTGGYVGTANPGLSFPGGLLCTSCHNPHGNGQYRILRPQPAVDITTGGINPLESPVYDPPLPSSGDTRNYTVIQKPGTPGNFSSFLLYTSQLGLYGSSSGDYFHRYVPWNDPNGSLDAPNGIPEPTAIGPDVVNDFNTEMTAWCSSCHTRYYNFRGPDRGTGDAIFARQHMTNVGDAPACTTCHVAHGSNAVMNTDLSAGTTFSANVPFPGQTTLPPAQVGNSRLLKFNGRGTCQACHDPTNTVAVGQAQGTVPNPLTP